MWTLPPDQRAYCYATPDILLCMDEPKKACGECGEVLPLIDFPLLSSAADGHHRLCFPCKRRVSRRHARKDEVRASRSDYARLRKYGLTPEAFAAKLAAQGGHCPFCAPGTAVPEAWDVDHDHSCCPGHWSCGRCVRAILCRLHNRGLGAFGDDPDLLRAAADYIERHRERIATAEPLRVKAAKRGDGHQNWKGDNLSRGGIHSRIWRAKGKPSGCAHRETAECTSERYEWTLVRDAKPTDPDSYISLCKPCRLAYIGHTGGGHARAKLTDEQAAEIRQRYAGGMRQVALAAEYGVSQAVVSEVVRGKSYKTVSGDRAGDLADRHREKVARDTSGSVTFGALRRRVYRARGPASRCASRPASACTNERYEWVLTPGADPAEMENWIPLCAACRVSAHGQHGEGNARAKLTLEDARAIRAKHAAGITQKALAVECGVTQATISLIILHRRYREPE